MRPWPLREANLCFSPSVPKKSTKSFPEGPFRAPGPPLGGLGGARPQTFGVSGAPGGGLFFLTRPLGGPFGALGGPKSIEITLVLCGFGPQRGSRRTPRTDSKNCKMDSVGRLKPRGPKWSGAGARDPRGAPLGPPKGSDNHWQNRFRARLENRVPQNVWFS